MSVLARVKDVGVYTMYARSIQEIGKDMISE